VNLPKYSDRLFIVGIVLVLLVPPVLVQDSVWFFFSIVGSGWVLICYMGYQEVRHKQ
jgi:hypothetical protein